MPALGRPTRVTKPERKSSGGTEISLTTPPRPSLVDADRGDASTFHALDAELYPIRVDRLPDLGYVSQHAEDQAADCVPVAVDELEFKQAFELVDRHPSMDQQLAACERPDEWFLAIGLIDDLADEFLDHVLEVTSPAVPPYSSTTIARW